MGCARRPHTPRGAMASPPLLGSMDPVQLGGGCGVAAALLSPGSAAFTVRQRRLLSLPPSSVGAISDSFLSTSAAVLPLLIMGELDSSCIASWILGFLDVTDSSPLRIPPRTKQVEATSGSHVYDGPETFICTELRCLTRKDLIEALAKDLPAGAIRFGCQIAAVHEDPGSHGAALTMVDGTTIKAKVLIGCEGTYSVVAKYLGLPPVKTIPQPALRGFTRYPHGHPFDNEFLQLRVGEIFIGRLPINDNLVHFFVNMPLPSTELTRDPKKVRDLALEDMHHLQCPAEIIELVRESDPESLNLVTKLWYRPPWEVAFASFQKGTVTVAGDAMHAMGPFIGQGGSTGLEDAIVLARALS